VLALRDGESDAVEHDPVAALHGNVLKVDQRNKGSQTFILEYVRQASACCGLQPNAA
jgi:hypothetical protein